MLTIYLPGLRIEADVRPQSQFESSGPAFHDLGGFALDLLTHRFHLDVEVLTAGCCSPTEVETWISGLFQF
jgi:hypothetical protein